MSIHPTAIIDPLAQLGTDVEVGPYSIIGPHCQIGDRTKIGSHVVLESHVLLGSDCQVASGAILGGHPQDLKFKNESTWVRIGNGCVIRECATVNRATGEGNETIVGEKCMLMAYSHVAHNCILGDEVILANSVQLGGHVEIGDYAFIGGQCAIHQFVKIGKLAIISGFSASRQDVPPFSMTDGRIATVAGINKIGLKRRGFDLAARTRMKKAFQTLFFTGMNYKQAIEALQAEGEICPEVQELISFIQNSTRGIYRPHRMLGVERSLIEGAEDPAHYSDALLEAN